MFQCHITSVLSSIPRKVIEVDDILVSGIDDIDHLNNLGKVFTILEEMGATVNTGKCKFFTSEVEYQIYC